jgi:hypothetical protein
MRAPLPIFALTYLVGCLQIGTGSGSGNGGSGSGGAADGGTGAPTSEGVPTGSGCVEDPQTHVVLCQRIDACPNVLVDPAAFPDCGFRLSSGSPLDLECLCGDALCPLGVPLSCADAERLLVGRDELQVCLQQTEGNCVTIVTPDAGSSTNPCSVCAAGCGGTPSCYAACGC